MSSPKEVIKEFVRGIDSIEKPNKLERDVSLLCSRLLSLGNDFYTRALVRVASNQRSQLQELLLERYNAIYWSLKLHIAFHIGQERALQHKELRNLGSFIKLTSELLENLPGEEHAVDPGSEVLEIVSTQISASNNECLDFTVIVILIPCCVYSHTIICSIAKISVTSSVVINMPTRELLAWKTKSSFV